MVQGGGFTELSISTSIDSDLRLAKLFADSLSELLQRPGAEQSLMDDLGVA